MRQPLKWQCDSGQDARLSFCTPIAGVSLPRRTTNEFWRPTLLPVA